LGDGVLTKIWNSLGPNNFTFRGTLASASLLGPGEHTKYVKHPTTVNIRRTGRYKPFSIIVRDEGQDEPAYQAAVMVVKSCISLTMSGNYLGGEHPWHRINPQTRRLEWMHLDTTFQDMYSTDFLTTENRRTTALADAIDDPMTPLKAARIGDGVAAPGEKRPRAASAEVPAKPGKSPKEKGQNDESAKKRKKEDQARWTKLMGQREKMRAATGSAKDLRDLIMSSQSWAWARSELVLNELDTATN
jgi:hypothetical protein